MKRGIKLIYISALTIFLFFLSTPFISAVDVSSCQTLYANNTIYTLTTNLSSATNCMLISGYNITLDGQGYSINGSNVYPYSAVYLVLSSNHSTIKNLNINNFSIGIYSPYSSNHYLLNNTIINSADYGLYIPSTHNHLLINNTILGSQGDGMYIASSHNNTLINNRVNGSAEKGIYFANSHNNTLYNNSITSNLNEGLYLSSASYNNFTYNLLFNNKRDAINLISSMNNNFLLDSINQSVGHAVNITGSNENFFSNISIISTNLSKYDFQISYSNNTKLSNFNSIFNYSFANISSIIFEDINYGQIKLINLTDVKGQNLTNDIILSNNSVFVNSSSNSGLNKSANITLYGIGNRFSNAKIFRDEIICTDCYNFTELNEAIVRFNVSSWSTYYIGEGPTIEQSTTSQSSSGGGGYLIFRSNNLSNGYNQIIYNNWRFSFIIGTEAHTIKINEISETKINITISSQIINAALIAGEEQKFDISGDDYYDLKVKLNSINYTDQFSPKANITIQTINEKVISTQENYEEVKENDELYSPPEQAKKRGFLFIGIFILLIGIIFIYFGRNKLKELPKNKNPIETQKQSWQTILDNFKK